ncbi:MAG: hypothetical protein CMJ64_25115 [Planctomycetaceae bacterium]|nr:hypothetical protein [Planctomycetaceae bacterium]
MKKSRTSSIASRLAGRTFVHPVFDYLLIGGGASLVVAAFVYARQGEALINIEMLPVFILFSNSAHFAASTVRLYTKPDSFKSLPFVTMLLPFVMLALLTICITWARQCGSHLQAIYLTWSPYHYAAQAYGLAVMYAYRSGCTLGKTDKRWLWWASMLPFFYVLIYGREGGLHWLLQTFVAEEGIGYFSWSPVLNSFSTVLAQIAFLLPAFAFYSIARGEGGSLPIISMLLIVTNGIWWYLLPALNAFAWATIFHGIQYLAIVLIFHLRDQMGRAGNRHGAAYHVAWFYLVSFALGYGLFQCLPFAYRWIGFGMLESYLLVSAAINIHHFIVDAYIWRLRGSDSNRRIVDPSLA